VLELITAPLGRGSNFFGGGGILAEIPERVTRNVEPLLLADT
jgi:hypothetical protein